MACTLASCVMPGTACGNAERTASGSRATCCHARALQPLRQLHSGRWHHEAAAAAAAPVTANLRGLLQHSARRRSGLSARRLSGVVATMPDPTTPETEKERSPLDYPQEWITPQPSRRPDIFPEFDKQSTPMPKPMPGDPELPDEEEEEEKKKKPDEDPDKDPEQDPSKPAPDTPPEE